MTLTPDTLEQLAALCRQAQAKHDCTCSDDYGPTPPYCAGCLAECAAIDTFSCALSPSVATVLVEIAQAAVRWADAGHTGDANCAAGDCDDCPARPALATLVAAIDRARGGAR